MLLHFANPVGFWALLAIPAILLLHFLQRQAVRLPVSTLFLLEQVQKESVQGRKFERLRHSLPLWLQLLAALLLAWLLVEPRWQRSDTVQRIAVVADSSASMSAFVPGAGGGSAGDAGESGPGPKEPADRVLARELDALVADHAAELTLLESHSTGRTLYHGPDPDALVDALRDWRPRRPAHDPGPALRLARSLAGKTGFVLYLTDRETTVPPSLAKVLAVGAPFANVGFAGLALEDSEEDGLLWRATVRNYSPEAAEREWFLATPEGRTPPRNIQLAPGETRQLSGPFPESATRLELRLQPDRFALDDRLPVVRPEPKSLVLRRAESERLAPLCNRLAGTLAPTESPAGETSPDLAFQTYNPLSPASPEGTGLVFLDQGGATRAYFDGPIVPDNHPLMEGLNWQGLIARRSPGMPLRESDRSLLWQGERSLVFLREESGSRQLVFNFDLASSNAQRLPAFAVLAHRFAKSVRDEKIAPFSENFELGQRLDLAVRRGENAPPLVLSRPEPGSATTSGEGGSAPGADGPSGQPLDHIPAARALTLRAPDEPGPFRVTQGGDILLEGAAHFADTREADFTDARSFSQLADARAEQIEQQTRADPLWQVWLLVLALLVLASWHFLGRESKTPEAA